MPFAVLTFLRIEHTLRHQAIISKRQAGENALHSGEDCWKRLIREALRIQYGAEQESLYASPAERGAETARFVEAYTKVCQGLLT